MHGCRGWHRRWRRLRQVAGSDTKFQLPVSVQFNWRRCWVDLVAEGNQSHLFPDPSNPRQPPSSSTSPCSYFQIASIYSAREEFQHPPALQHLPFLRQERRNSQRGNAFIASFSTLKNIKLLWFVMIEGGVPYVEASGHRDGHLPCFAPLRLRIVWCYRWCSPHSFLLPEEQQPEQLADGSPPQNNSQQRNRQEEQPRQSLILPVFFLPFTLYIALWNYEVFWLSLLRNCRFISIMSCKIARFVLTAGNCQSFSVIHRTVALICVFHCSSQNDFISISVDAMNEIQLRFVVFGCINHFFLYDTET